MTSLAPALGGIRFGGDYNPEQWPRETWREDVALMQRAGVDLVSVGVFSWAWLEPEPGRYTFGWLDEVLDVLAAGGVMVDLATATASPPAWLAQRHPETLPVTADGTTLAPGSRQAYCPSSPIFRERAGALVEQLASRYRDHRALAMWHVGNEYGCHVSCCWCDTSAAAYRTWLQARHCDLDALNDAWGTAFWSQRYTDWGQVQPPRATPTFANPGQQLDFRRFSSDEHLACFVAERDQLHEITPGVPVTTNFMAHSDVVDYWSWADELDVVSNDHYLRADDPANHVDLAFDADVTRGLARGRPWLLMEHSTGAVNWQPRNVPKCPGETVRNSLQHVARGADGALFFQWRQSRAGAEKYHSAMVPHAGPDSRLFREVVELGGILERLAPVAGSIVQTDVALLFCWESWWAVEADGHPSVDLHYREAARDLHKTLFAQGITVDVVQPGVDLDRYRLVLAPMLHLVSDDTVTTLDAYVRAGGHLLVTYFSGIVDPRDQVRHGGYPGAFRDMLGVRVEELRPLLATETVRLTGPDGDGGTADRWTEDLHVVSPETETVLRYADGPLEGVPAVTRRPVGDGVAWYVATRPDPMTTARLLARACADAGVEPTADVPAGVEVVRRRGGEDSYLFVLNHSEGPASVGVRGIDLMTGDDTDGAVAVAAGGVAVVHEPAGTVH